MIGGESWKRAVSVTITMPLFTSLFTSLFTVVYKDVPVDRFREVLPIVHRLFAFSCGEYDHVQYIVRDLDRILYNNSLYASEHTDI